LRPGRVCAVEYDDEAGARNHMKPYGEQLSITITLQGTNISRRKALLKMNFLFAGWDMLVPWRVYRMIRLVIEVRISCNFYVHDCRMAQTDKLD